MAKCKLLEIRELLYLIVVCDMKCMVGGILTIKADMIVMVIQD